MRIAGDVRSSLASDVGRAQSRDSAVAPGLLHDRIALAAAKWPRVVAVQCGDATLCYADLEAAATRLAHRLRSRGVVANTRVGLLVERSTDMVVAVLAILKAGCAYVPIDPANPKERIAFLLSDAALAAVVIHEHYRAQLPPSCPPIVSLDAECDTIARESAAPLPDVARPDSLAYVMYTSGSTGQPKGVQIEHRSVLAFLDGLSPHIPFERSDIHASVASLSFDISGLDLFATLSSGARLLLVPREIVAQPRELRDYLAQQGATSLQATPTAWRMLLEAGWRADRSFRALSGGEALPQSLADALTAMGLEVWNLYGPTEATIYACVARIRAGDQVTLGRPLAGTPVHVLDECGEPVVEGTEGVLFLGGPQVARGYLNRPELTTERFRPDRFSSVPGARLYNTGDVVRQRDDGALEYLGRRDDQVKVRGFRIELGEIEAALVRHDRVVSAAVVVQRRSTDDEPKLIAYVTVRRGRPIKARSVYVPLTTTIRQFVAESLPSHMVPERVVVLNELPVTVAGKVDRVTLAATAPPNDVPEFARSGPVVAPRTDLERRLVDIFERVLEVQPIGVTDNFFDLGATSVGAARLFTEIERTIGGALPLAPLFIAPTVERLARLIAAHSATGSGAHRFTSLVTIQPSGPRTPIFCVHGGVGTILHFGRLARYLGNDQPFYGLQMQGLEGGQPLHMSVRAMARHYVREITTLQPRGPYVIAGYCFGAIVAQEMARLLSSTGESVPLLMSFNGPSSSYIRRRERRGTSRERLAREWCKLRWAGRMIKGRAWATLGRRFDDNTLRGTIVAITHYVERQYRAMPWHGPMVVAQSATLFSEDGIGWRDVDGIRVETHVSQTWGDDARFLMVEPAVSWLADVVRDAVDRYAGAATAARH